MWKQRQFKNLDANFDFQQKCASLNEISGSPTDNYLISYDGLRIDNVSTINPLYSLVGYDVIKTDDALPILKQENTNNYIEYRFGIGVTS